jgi:biopolymer transport protein ExbD
MGRRKRGTSVNLDSFLDLMTCMLGILILMILLTGIDASQIKVLIPTPMEQESDKRPLFIECRNNELFLISIEDISRQANEAIRALAEKAKNNEREFMNA